MTELLHRSGRVGTRARRDAALAQLQDVPVNAWATLVARALEPNGYYRPEWARAVDASARGRTSVAALCAWSFDRTLIGLSPVISARRAYRLPLPVLVAAEAYGTLRTPLLDETCASIAARGLLSEAQRAGARALVLQDVPLDGAAVAAFRTTLAADGLAPIVLRRYPRAVLDARQDADALLKGALGTKKSKELRRLRQRLHERGDVQFVLARTVDEIARALDIFLRLEASGWKGRRGTALAEHAGDTAFIRSATAALAAQNACEIAVLMSGADPVAAGIVLKHRDRAFWFKLGIDLTFARFSPGIQLACELTRYFCADPAIAMVDSTAAANNSLIDSIWRDRMAMGDVLLPLKRDPLMPIIHAALAGRQIAEDTARDAVRLIRRLRTSRA